MRGRYNSGHAEVSEIGTELAIPFMREYAKRWNLPFNDDALDGVEWLGAWYNGSLRAVGGIRDLSFLGGRWATWRYVYGFYGDGGAHQNVGVHAIGKALVDLPFGLAWGGLFREPAHDSGRTPTRLCDQSRPRSRDQIRLRRAAAALEVLQAVCSGKMGWNACWVAPTPQR